MLIAGPRMPAPRPEVPNALQTEQLELARIAVVSTALRAERAARAPQAIEAPQVLIAALSASAAEVQHGETSQDHAQEECADVPTVLYLDASVEIPLALTETREQLTGVPQVTHAAANASVHAAALAPVRDGSRLGARSRALPRLTAGPHVGQVSAGTAIPQD